MVKADTAEFYYVSLREATGVDAGLGASFVNTVSVHRATGNLPTKTYLLQVLTAGQSFSDATNGITITNQGASGGVATVGVSMGGGVCSRASPTVAVSPAFMPWFGRGQQYLSFSRRSDRKGAGLNDRRDE